jgi:hypothetical protein
MTASEAGGGRKDREAELREEREVRDGGAVYMERGQDGQVRVTEYSTGC